MKTVLLSIVMGMIILNVISFAYGKKKIKNLEINNDNSEEKYKEGMKYVIISLVLTFITLIGVSIVAVLNYLL